MRLWTYAAGAHRGGFEVTGCFCHMLVSHSPV